MGSQIIITKIKNLKKKFGEFFNISYKNYGFSFSIKYYDCI